MLRDEKRHLFLSSSSDMKTVREQVAKTLSDWMRQHELDIASYEWDVETDQGRLLKDRMPIQSQLPDPYETFGKVPFTICLFGERCGVPLTPDISKDWSDRLSRWRATDERPGLYHPWPEVQDDQDRLLEAGSFPLTGTVFELISAFEASPDAENLMIGYVADKPINSSTTIDDYFNHNRERKRLLQNARNEREARTILKENYYPQVHALINLLRVFERISGTSAPVFSTQSDLVRKITEHAKRKLRRHFGITSPGNPFKNTLEHWTVEDTRSLPGRTGMIDEIEQALDRNNERSKPGLVLIKGTSGCGKSSLLNRGVLGRMADRGHHVLAFRPTDFSRGERDHVDILWDWICEAIPAAKMRAPKPRHRLNQYAERLRSVLEEQHRYLVLGLDQFEEILDELNQFKTKSHRRTGFWLFLDFLNQLARCRRVHLVATLESARWDTFCALDIEAVMGMQRLTFEADVSADQVARIAKAGFDSVQIELDDPLIEEIKSQFEALHRQTASRGTSASPLPLIGLGLARLFENFEHLAAYGREAGMKSEFSRSSEMALLKLDQVQESKALNFEGMVAELAEEAWAAAGENRIHDWPVEKEPELCRTLATFLGHLVALDDDSHIRLQVVSSSGADTSQTLLLKEFAAKRLLIPARREEGDRYSLRLAHQAVVDQWEPAKSWFTWQMEYLEIERGLRRNATAWRVSGYPTEKASPKYIQAAAQVLFQYRGAYVLDGGVSDEDMLLVRYSQHLFQHAKNPFEKVGNVIGDRCFADIAALYQSIDVLESFAMHTKDFLKISGEMVCRMLGHSSWTDGPGIVWMLRHFNDEWKSADDWHPIIGAIQGDARKNFIDLLETIDDCSKPVGPVGFTLLGQAARYGKAYHCETILSKNCDYEAPDEKGNTAAMWAAIAGNIDTFRIILPGCDIEGTSSDDFKYSAVHFASQNGHDQILCHLFDSPDLDAAKLARLLSQQDGFGRSPLFLAAAVGRANVVELLLTECDPRDVAHRNESGGTLFHAAVSGFAQSQNDRVRARRVIELLIKDGRLPVNTPDNEGRTAFEIAKGYPEARRLLRRHTKIAYANMKEAMRKADLQSTTFSDALTLIGKNPNALTDFHEGERGIDILIAGEKTYVLAKLVADGLIDDDLLLEIAGRLVELIGPKTTDDLRSALLARFTKAHVEYLPALLDAALRYDEDENAAAACRLGVREVWGIGPLRSSVFHDWARQGRQERFEEIACKARLALPVDVWGRRPSDCAADHDRVIFRQLEDRLFDPSVKEGLFQKCTEKFHKFAKSGNVKAFERQARGANRSLPFDEDGKRPSEVAPDEHRAQIAEIEERYFLKVH